MGNVIYKNFICYRDGAGIGGHIAKAIYDKAREKEDILGKTYCSFDITSNDSKNFYEDPKKHMANVENVILLLTDDFFNGFIENGIPNEKSVTRIEINEALKNPNINYINVVWPKFSWDKENSSGITNRDLLIKLWGEESAQKIIGSIPVIDYKDASAEKKVIIDILHRINNDITENDFDNIYTLESTPSVIPKIIFCGREEELSKIKELFDEGERVIFLQGIGGIGKTQIAMQYAKRCRNQYDTIVYATYTNSIIDLFTSQQSPFKLSPTFPRLKKSDESFEEDSSFFIRKLDEIKKITDSRTLIIIDNFDVMDDENLHDLLEGNYKLLITTRCDYSKLFPTIKIKPLDSIEQLRSIFIENVKERMRSGIDNELLDELINLVNRHTYTLELIAQHMSRYGVRIENMITSLKEEGIGSLKMNANDDSSIAYQNLSKMFKVLDLNASQKYVLKILSLFPIGGVTDKDLSDWLGPEYLAVIDDLENRSWLASSTYGVALHPIIRDVVRNELKITPKEAIPFLQNFNETIKEEKSWHYKIDEKCYYGEIGNEIIKVFNELNEDTLELYKNVEILLSFEVKPARAIELCKQLFEYYELINGDNNCFMCAYYSFQAGWTYLFNLHLPSAFENAKYWFDISYQIFKSIKINEEHEYAVYGHLLTHMARVCAIFYRINKNEKTLVFAENYAKEALVNAETHFVIGSPFYSRKAVAYMQLAEVYIAWHRYEEALSLLDKSYDIVVSLFGEKDSDSINVACRKSAVLFYLGRFEEALVLGKKNLADYAEYSGELNSLRFEQLLVVYRCIAKIGNEEEKGNMREQIIRIATQFMSKDSPMFKEILAE